MADVASGASDSGQLRVEPGARWPKERAERAILAIYCIHVFREYGRFSMFRELLREFLHISVFGELFRKYPFLGNLSVLFLYYFNCIAFEVKSSKDAAFLSFYFVKTPQIVFPVS